MKIEQPDDFKPITLTLETREEAIAFWAMVSPEGERMVDPRGKELSTKISSWFSEQAHL